MKRVGLIEACDDPKLLNFNLWPKQREILESVERGGRLHAWCLGRRAGKSTLGAVVLLHNLLLSPQLDAKVRRGERRYGVAVGTNLQQARLVTRQAASNVEASPLLRGQVESITEDEILFKGGRCLRAFPCTSRGGRGWPISALILDEAAFHLDTDGNQAGDRIWQALSPSAAQFGDDARLIVSSTPFGSSGFFYDFFHRAESGEIPDAVAVHATTQEVNPEIDPAYLAAEQGRDPDAYEAEFLARFLGSGDSFLNFDLFSADAPPELPPEAGRDWLVGLDPSFSSDPLGICIVGRSNDDPKRLIVGRAAAWKPQRRKPGSFEELASVQECVLAEVIEYVKPYKPTRVTTDQYAARSVIDRLRRDGLHAAALPLTAQSKTQIFSELRSAIYGGRLMVPAHPDLLSELRRLRSRYAAGSASVLTPRSGGSHCDMAVALALALWNFRAAGDGSPGRLPRGGGEGVGARLSLGVGGRPSGGPVEWRDEAQMDAISGTDRAATGPRKWGGESR
jgi:hypothetical protein